MVVHPIGKTTGKTQVLANKPGEWKLAISPDGFLEWGVYIDGSIVTAKGKTVLQSQLPNAAATGYVVKATHCAGVVKVFVCVLEPDFDCRMPTPDGTAYAEGVGPKGWGANHLPIGATTNAIIFGAASGGAGDLAVEGFDGALEEIFLYKITLEEVVRA